MICQIVLDYICRIIARRFLPSTSGRTEKVDLGLPETLIERGNLFNYKKAHFFLFSKSGFAKGCTEKAKALGNVTLVTYG